MGKQRRKQYVFDGERGKHRNDRLTPRKLSQIIQRLRKLAKITGKLSAKSFRRSFATYQHRCGTSLFIIGKALGTLTVEGTVSYIQNDQENTELNLVNVLAYLRDP